MARLPVPGSDQGTWGDVLNDFLAQAHNADGTLKDGVISEAKLDAAAQTKLNNVGSVVDADATTKGKIQLAGDLGGTAASPTVPGLASKADTSALTAGLANKVDTTTTVNGHALSGNVTVSKTDVSLGNVDNTSDANKPVSTATQTALNAKAPLASPTFTGTVTVPTPSNNTDAATKLYVDSAVPAGTPDADATTKGKIQLTGDLGGTAASPTVPGLAGKVDASTMVNGHALSGNVTVSKSDIGLGNVPNTDATDRSNHTGTQAHTTITGLGTAATADTGTGATEVILGNDVRLTDQRVPTDDSVTVTKLADSSVTLSKIDSTAYNPSTSGAVSTKNYADVASLVDHPALAPFKHKYNLHNDAYANNGSPWLYIGGDSIAEGYSASSRELRWGWQLTQLLARGKRGYSYYVPSAASTFSSLDATDWPGGTTPWRYSATGFNRTNAYGLGMHAVVVPASGWIEIDYFGDSVTVHHTKTSSGAATVTPAIDGTNQATFSTNNAATQPGQASAVGTVGQSDLGWHTLRLTPTGGTLTLEGVTISEAKGVFGFNFDAVNVRESAHAGFAVSNFIDANAYWDKSVSTPDLMLWSLGANDVAAVSSATYQTNLVSLFQRIDTTLGTTTTPHLMLMWPGIGYASTTIDGGAGTGMNYVRAAYKAAELFDPRRVLVIDMSQYMPLDRWNAINTSGHPNDDGHSWIAKFLADILAPGVAVRQLTDSATQRIPAATPPWIRRSWAESLSFVSGVGELDYAPTGTTAGERIHKLWLERGIYQVGGIFELGAANGIAQAYINGTSLGTQDQYAASTSYATQWFSATFTAPAAGFYYLRLRKTGTKNASSTGYRIGVSSITCRRS